MSKAIQRKQLQLKQKLIDTALDLGFDDVKFFKNPVASDKNIAMLVFKRYTPSDGKAADGRIAVSAYYPCSQAGYLMVNELAAILNADLKIPAERTDAIQYKRLALKGGGRVGWNTLYYHKAYGSYVHMQCLLIRADIPTDEVMAGYQGCEECGACISACPTKAITKNGWSRDKCLRNMFSVGIPARARKHVYQLLGCEKCQMCCPMNTADIKPATTVDLVSTLKGEQTRYLKEIAGKNMATRTRILTQAICYAVSTHHIKALPAIALLAQDQSERIKKTANWAAGRLKKYSENESPKP